MRRERSSTGGRRRARGGGRGLWLGGGIAVVGAVLVWAALGGTAGPPPSRPLGAGLPPSELARIAPTAPPVERTSPPAELDTAVAARRAEIGAEEARLAALRSTRAQLEQEIAALRQQAEERRRDMPGRKNIPETVAAGPTAPASPATGGGQPAVATAAPAPPQPEPVARGMRVFVHHRANSAPASSAAEEVAQTLRSTGVEVPAIRPAPFVPSTPVVRYFHEDDQAAAARLAGRLGRGWAIQDFRAFVPQPPPQTLEVWLPGN